MTCENAIRQELINFVMEPSFPCFMAKSVSRIGLMRLHITPSINNLDDISNTKETMYGFIDEYRKRPNRLSSFALVIKDEIYSDFDYFEKAFWFFLQKLHVEDKKLFPHDQKVSSKVDDNDFSYSIKSEAFFILALHPKSPRLARRFKYPTIIFNPHAQFETLKIKGLFNKIRDAIRLKDKLLQGHINPMLNDFGEKTEVFQYLGKSYRESDTVPLKI
jgi:FPC/CPF motif-containing protein YcgG